MKSLHRWLVDDMTGDLHALNQCTTVLLSGEKVRPNDWPDMRIGRSGMDRASRLRPQLRDADRHARISIKDAFRSVCIAGIHEEKLDIRPLHSFTGPDEAVHQSRPKCEDTLPGRSIARGRP